MLQAPRIRQAVTRRVNGGSGRQAVNPLPSGDDWTVLDDGTVIYDSVVICEYFDSLHDGEKLFALVQVPAVLPRFVQLPGEKGCVFVPLEADVTYGHLREELDDGVGGLGHSSGEPTLKLGAQRAPAREAVLARDGALCRRELRARVLAAQRLEPALCRLAIPVGVRACQGTPSFMKRPASARDGQKEGPCERRRRRVRPFTRTVGRLFGRDQDSQRGDRSASRNGRRSGSPVHSPA
jgi:hypothetical protein